MARHSATVRSAATPPVLPAPPDHPLDRAVRFRDRAAVPEVHRPAYDAVLLAFQKYEAGDDEAARAALQPIGLQSPFLDWKVLLRGLMAYSAGDDSRAIENWQRLANDRLPARLAAPVRATIDPAFAHVQPPQIRECGHALLVGPVAATLYELRAAMTRDQALSAAFRLAERALGILRPQYPHVIPRLATLFYRAILSHGEPDDLARYRKVFGAPPDDPGFHKLEGLLYAEADRSDQAHRHLAAFEAWLASNPPGWPADIAQRARAMILCRMAEIAVDASDSPGQTLHQLFSTMFGEPKPRVKLIDPVPLWRSVCELAPDWERPATTLFDYLVAANKPAEAEAVARKLFDHNPNATKLLDKLTWLLTQRGRAVEALDLRSKALATNPLDKQQRTKAALSYFAATRRHLIDGDPTTAAINLEAGKSVCEENAPTAYYTLMSSVARKMGRASDADTWQAKALDVPGGRLVAALYLAVDAALLKSKPADKKPFDKLLADALSGPATPQEANLLYAAWDQYSSEGLEYRGQKTQEKKIQAVVLRSVESDSPVRDFEALATALQMRAAWAILQKFATKCRNRFPSNPVFVLMNAYADCHKPGGISRHHKIIWQLRTTRALIERSPDPRHADLLPAVQELERQVIDINPFDAEFDEED